MMIDEISFEGFFNAVHRSLDVDGYANPGRTAMNESAFNSGVLSVLPLRALQMGIAYLVNAGELTADFNDKASALTTAADAHALLEDVRREAAEGILARTFN